MMMMMIFQGCCWAWPPRVPPCGFCVFKGLGLALLSLSLPLATCQRGRARLLAFKVSHSSDWLYAHPITACCLRFSGEAIHVAVGLRLGLSLCATHLCPCGTTITSRGTHGLSCKRSSGCCRSCTRHHQ